MWASGLCEKAVGKVRALEATVGWSSASLLRPLVVMARGAVDREPVIQAVQSLGSRMAVKHGRGGVMEVALLSAVSGAMGQNKP